MGNTIQNGITRPYVGQNSQSITDVKQTGDKKSGDVTSPQKPQVLRAWAFELAADGTTVAPPPANAHRRDPVVIELGQIEVGTRIEVISLSDNPQAEFSELCKGEVFELPLTGYDVGNRRGSVALNAEQMKEKGIVAGERLMLRQVDKDGNASEAVHVFLDPNGWANQTLNEPVQGGGTQQVRGRQIDVAVGVINLQGNPNPGKTDRVLGKATVDQSAPKLVEGNVSVVSDQLSKAEHDLLKGYVGAMPVLVGAGNYTLDQIKQTLDANAGPWSAHPTYKAPYDVLRAVLADSARLVQFTSALGAGSGAAPTAANVIDWAQASALAALATEPTATFIKLDKALEPGVTVSVQNSRTGEAVSIGQGAEARSSALVLRDVRNGDPLILTYRDQAGNPGAPYGFRYDPASKDGKAKSNPLDIRLGAFNLKPQPTPTQGT